MNKLLVMQVVSLLLIPAVLNSAGPLQAMGGGLVYRYEIVPKGEKERKGTAEIVIGSSGDHVDYAAKITLHDTREEIRIRTTPPGKFLSAQKRTIAAGRDTCCQEITVSGATASVAKEEGGNRSTTEIDLPRDRELAVDGSLLMLVQSFPFDQGKSWELFMVDFSSFSTSVTIRQTGRERIIVPAGEFDCYRMELTLNIPVFRPKITYWIAATEPHFVVKHQGKRGPFTATYVTSLVSSGKQTAITSGPAANTHGTGKERDVAVKPPG